MERITSFTVDHDLLEPGIYLSRVDGDVTTYDLRTRKPNMGDYMDNLTMHSVEHMVATHIRNSELRDDVIYFGPMGCQTGFYFLFDNTKLTNAQAIALLDQGETYWMDEEQTKLVMESNRRFKQLTAEEQFFYDCFAIPDSESDGQYLSATTIFQRIRRHAGASLRYGNASQFSRVLTNIEGLKHRRTSHGSEYLVKEL